MRGAAAARSPAAPTGYQRNGPPTFAPVTRLGVAAKGEWSWTLPGVFIGGVPAQVVTAPPPPAPTPGADDTSDGATSDGATSDGATSDGATYAGPSYVSGQKSLAVSWWLPALAFAALPAARAWRRAVRRRRERRAGRNLCPACGYDLRATPARCPECGHVPSGAEAHSLDARL